MYRHCLTLSSAAIHRGRVVRWSDRTGYGFIEKLPSDSKFPTTGKSQQLFVHFKDIVADKSNGFKFLSLGQEVEFTEHVSSSGYRAANVTALNGAPIVSEERQRHGRHPFPADTGDAANDKSLLEAERSTTTAFRRAKAYRPGAFGKRHWGSSENATAAAPVQRPHYTSGWSQNNSSPYL